MDDNMKALLLFAGLTAFLFIMGWAFNDRNGRSE